MSNLKFTMAMAAMAAMLLARADEFAWPTSSADPDVIVLETSDSGGADNSLQNGAHWSSKDVPDNQHHYWVPSGKTIRGQSNTDVN